MKTLATVVALAATINVQALTTYNDKCLDGVTRHALGELEAFGHRVTIKRCMGSNRLKRLKRAKRREMLLKMYRYDNKNDYVKAYRGYLNGLGIHVGYSKTPWWK